MRLYTFLVESTLNRFWLVVMVFSCVCTSWSADFYYTNTAGDFTNNLLWSPTTTPGAGDNAYVTNDASGYTISWTTSLTNANAYFDQKNGTITLGVGSGNTWFLTNEFVVGQLAGSTGTISHTSGTIVITNSSGTGQLFVGADGKGIFTLGGGTVITDHLWGTNFSTTAKSSDVNLNSGTLTTLGDSLITASNDFNVGVTAGKTMTWNINGGITRLRLFDNSFFQLGTAGGATGQVIISGSSAVISNNANIYVGETSGGNILVASNGASIYNTGNLTVGRGAGGTNIVLISGSGTTWTNGGDFLVGSVGTSDGNILVVSNGAVARTASSFRLGTASGGNSNMLIVTDSGSVLSADSVNRIGDGGSLNTVLVTNGGQIKSTGATRMSESVTARNNQLIISGAGSLFYETSSITLGSNATTKGSGYISILDNGTLQLDTITMGFINGAGEQMGAITNFGGVIQFVGSSPSISTNNSANSIVVTNGTISYIAASAAVITNINVDKITFQGNNTFQLNNSTSAFLNAYTFAPGNNANYQNLTLVNSASRWQTTNTTFGSGGIFTVSNAAAATVFGLVTHDSGSVLRMVVTNGGVGNLTLGRGAVIAGTGDNGNGVIQNISGTNTITGPITMSAASTIGSGTATSKLLLDSVITNGGFTLTLNGAGTTFLGGVISGNGGLAVKGGTVVLTNSAANLFIGATTITNATLKVSMPGALDATSGITISGSGTLLLDGSGADRVGNGVGVSMDGGSINVNDKTETMGTLTMVSNSTIDLNYNGTVGDLTFTDSAYTAGTLTINGWNGTLAGGGDDRIFFTSNSGGATFLNNVTFTGFNPGALRLGSGELVPAGIPEPGTVFGGMFVVVLLARRWIKRHRLN
jgi:fibronectin-binding autotransporter adhesin